MQANTNIYNLTNSKKSVVLNQAGETNKVMKYVGGDSIVYKNIYVQNENPLDYYGRIYESGDTLHLDSQNISLSGNVASINMYPSVKIGLDAGKNIQDNNCIAIGTNAGYIWQKDSAVAIGTFAGHSGQGTYSIAIGNQAGKEYQQKNSVAIGNNAGNSNQEAFTIAIGKQSGQTNQKTESIAIGHQAGSINQQLDCIAIGANAGQTNQQNYGIAIGTLAGGESQGQYAVAIGTYAGRFAQHDRTIIINATGSALNSTTSSSFYVNPIRGAPPASAQLVYNTSTKEITYNTSSIRYKENVIDLSKDTSVLYNLTPREYDSKINGKHYIGFIAEELAKQSSDFVWLNQEQQPEGIEWNNIITYLVAEVKKLKNSNDVLISEIQTLKTLI